MIGWKLTPEEHMVNELQPGIELTEMGGTQFVEHVWKFLESLGHLVTSSLHSKGQFGILLQELYYTIGSFLGTEYQ